MPSSLDTPDKPIYRNAEKTQYFAAQAMASALVLYRQLNQYCHVASYAKAMASALVALHDAERVYGHATATLVAFQDEVQLQTPGPPPVVGPVNDANATVQLASTLIMYAQLVKDAANGAVALRSATDAFDSANKLLASAFSALKAARALEQDLLEAS